MCDQTVTYPIHVWTMKVKDLKILKTSAIIYNLQFCNPLYILYANYGSFKLFRKSIKICSLSPERKKIIMG